MGETTHNAVSLLSPAQRHFFDTHRVARFASADVHGQPHVLPECYCVLGESIYFSIDEKPKQANVRRLKRLGNIAQNPQVALVVDRHARQRWPWCTV